MDRRLLDRYEQQLRQFHRVRSELSSRFPLIAGALADDVVECPDPYVERLMEAFVFLGARVHHKLDAQLDNVAQGLAETMYPHLLRPIPSMCIVRLEPEAGRSLHVPRGTVLDSAPATDAGACCRFTTAHEVNLAPIEVVSASYRPSSHARSARSAMLEVSIRSTNGLALCELGVDWLDVFLHASGSTPSVLFEHLVSHARSISQDGGDERPARFEPIGFAPDEALLRYPRRSFSGYRIVQEYLTFPQRYLFLRMHGVGALMSGATGEQAEIRVAIDGFDPALTERVDASTFVLGATPAVNLFERRLDRVPISTRFAEHHVVASRVAPLDFEIHDLLDVEAHGANPVRGAPVGAPYTPIRASTSETSEPPSITYSMRRLPRTLSAGERRRGPRASYIGSEVFVMLSPADAAIEGGPVESLSVRALCSNRDLPILMPVGQASDFEVDAAGVRSAHRLIGPTSPREAPIAGDSLWRVLRHLAGADKPVTEAESLRRLLSIYAPKADARVAQQIGGIVDVRTSRIERQTHERGRTVSVDGLHVDLTLDPGAFEGMGGFLLATVLDRYFAASSRINCVTETAIRRTDRQEFHSWPARTTMTSRL